MGFPSPATDYVEQRISLDERIITRPAATYFMRAGATHYREGILNGALLVVDASLSPCDGGGISAHVGNPFFPATRILSSGGVLIANSL